METWLGCEAADLREEAQACTRQQTTEHTLRRTTKGTLIQPGSGANTRAHHVGRPERVLLAENPNEASWNRRKENTEGDGN